MRARVLASVLALALPPARADPIVLLVDGDTIKIGSERIRIVDIDAPESFLSRCEAELVLALAAKQRLRELLDGGPVRIEVTGTDRYRRTLAHVFAGDVDIGATLVAEGHALPYQPGPTAKLARLKAWCGPDAEDAQ
jgi:endonuclease YncB( thermonuclease family)